MNPNIKDYDWANMIGMTHNIDNGCKDAYCPTAKYDLQSVATQVITNTIDPCFCLGIDITDPKYFNCYCFIAENANKFPCKCFDQYSFSFPFKLYTSTRDDTSSRENCNCKSSEI